MTAQSQQTPITEAEFREIVDSNSAKLTRYAMSYTHNVETARDIVQECFLKLAKSKYKGDKEQLVPWLFTVCRNLSIDHIRKETRRMQKLQNHASEIHSEYSADPMHAAAKSELTQQILNCIDHLPERQQEVIRLKFQSGLSYKDIAEVTQLSVTNVGFILHTAIRSIKERMKAIADT